VGVDGLFARMKLPTRYETSFAEVKKCGELYHHSCTSSYVFYLGTSTSMTSHTEHIYANVGNLNFFCVCDT